MVCAYLHQGCAILGDKLFSHVSENNVHCGIRCVFHFLLCVVRFQLISLSAHSCEATSTAGDAQNPRSLGFSRHHSGVIYNDINNMSGLTCTITASVA